MDDVSESSDKNEEALEVVVVPDTEPLPRPDYSTAELNELVAAIKRTIILRDLGEHHWTDENTEVVKSWLCTTSHELISFYFVDGKLSASLSYPEMHVDDCFYFIRDSNNVFTMDNFHDDVTFGYNDQDVTGHMLTVMEHIYAPYFLCKSNATDAPRGHFRQALYLFLARLTEFHHKLSGSTFLYVPSEVHTLSTEEAASDSQLVNRLELVAEHWIFQLRLTLNDKEPVTPYKLQWPNDEYEFWNYRCNELARLNSQTSHKDFQHIVSILRNAQSTFVEPIERTCADLAVELERAKSNLSHLQQLREPCAEIANADSVSTITLKLSTIIKMIRNIWLHSPFYTGDVMIAKLYRFVGNQIIDWCQRHIDIHGILRGRVNEGKLLMQSCIDCCIDYRTIHRQLSTVEDEWQLNDVMILNHVDSFAQRLRDCVEICDGILIFGDGDSYEETLKFGGEQCDEFDKTCEQIKLQFRNALQQLIDMRSDEVLNVLNVEWHVKMAAFQSVTKHLDSAVENLMINVFSRVHGTEEGIYALACLFRYTKRTKLSRSYRKHVEFVWNMFADEIAVANHTHINQFTAEPLPGQPKYAGRVIHLQKIRDHLQHLEGLLDRATFMPPPEVFETILSDYAHFISSANANIQKQFDEWLQLIGVDSSDKLNCKLLLRSLTHPGLFECNINTFILDTFDEAIAFKQLRFEFPLHVNQFVAKVTHTRVAFDSIVDMCIVYNKILESISDKERILLRPVIQKCDRAILPGVHKLTWVSDGLDAYVADCNRSIDELKQFLTLYRNMNYRIEAFCAKICDEIVLRIASKDPATLEIVSAELKSHCQRQILTLLTYHNGIVELLYGVYDALETHMPNISRMWNEYVKQFDCMIQKALIVCARSSLRSVWRTLHGTGVMKPASLIKVSVVIHARKIETAPTMQELNDLFGNANRLLVDAISHLPRLCDRFGLQAESKTSSYSDAIASDEEFRQIQAEIMTELVNNQREMCAYIEQWTPFAVIWQLDRSNFMQHFGACDDIAAIHFARNINQFTEISNDIAIREPVLPVNFMVVNASELQRRILYGIDEWQSEYAALLKAKTDGKIAQLHSYMAENGHHLIEVPESVDDLHRCSTFYDNLSQSIGHWKIVLVELAEYLDVLRRCRVISDTEFADLKGNMTEEWNEHLNKLGRAPEILDDARNRFKLML